MLHRHTRHRVRVIVGFGFLLALFRLSGVRVGHISPQRCSCRAARQDFWPQAGRPYRREQCAAANYGHNAGKSRVNDAHELAWRSWTNHRCKGFSYRSLSRRRFASYWLHAFHVMSEPADVANYPPSSVALDSRMTGFNPFYAPPLVDDPGIASVFGAGIPTRILNAVTSNIDDTYLAMARADGKKHAVRFVEKFHPNHLPWLVWTVYPNAKELFLVRDFRDMFCSILSFNKKRGYPAFGREKYGTDEEFASWAEASSY